MTHRTHEPPIRRHPRIDPSGRHAMAAGHALLAMLIALGIGSLLNADSLRDAAEAQPFGWRRSVAVGLVRPVDGLSGLLRLDRPRVAIDDVLGRESFSAQGVATQPVEEPGRPAPGPSAPAINSPSPAAPPRIQPGETLGVFVVGDSLTETMGAALAEQAAGVAEVTHDFRYSTGLSRPDFFDWPARFDEILTLSDHETSPPSVGTPETSPDASTASSPGSAAPAASPPSVGTPDAFVVMFGGNDAQDIRTADGVVPLGSPEWVTAYGARVGAVMDQLTADGRAVVWVGMPVMRSGAFDAKARMLNEIYAEQAATRDRVAFLDTRAMFATAEGAYADYLPDASGTTQLMRRGDGIHLSPAGGSLLAAAVLDVLAEQWPLAPAPAAS